MHFPGFVEDDVFYDHVIHRPGLENTMAWLELDGLRLSVEESGTKNGRPLVLVHGQGGDLHTWDSLSRGLHASRRVIRYDLRDFGLSRASSLGRFSHSNDLALLLDAMSLQDCDLAGVSMGGGIALNFALNYPERVRRLVLISPQILGWDWSEEWRVDWARVTNAARAGNFVEAKRLWWEHPLFTSTRRSAAADSLRAEIDRFEGRQWVEDGQEPVMPDVERLHELDTATLLLSGRQDVDELRLMTDILAASSDLVERRYMSGGHLLQLEQPDECVEHIEAFLTAPVCIV